MNLALRWFAIVAVAGFATWSASAGTRKVIVLPLDGSADEAQRTKLTAEVVKLARSSGGDVSPGNTTFAETAAAVGCDPAVPACADTVLATLGVDEVIYGTATTTNGQTTIVITRVTKGAAPFSQTLAIQATDEPEKADPGLAPIFGAPVLTDTLGSGLGSGSGSAAPQSTGTSFFDTTDRKVGFGLAVGGGAAIVIGLAFWASESNLQGQINTAPANSSTDLKNLVAKEDKASSEAWSGNVLVFLGLAAGSVGGYYLWRDHKARATATVAPVEHGTGATLVVGGHW